MFLGESGSGHTAVMDGAEEQGGRNMGIRPMEMLLLGLGGCASFDVMTMLKKSRQQVTDCRTEVQAERVDAVPAVFSKIHLHFLVTGTALRRVKSSVRWSCRRKSTARHRLCSKPRAWKCPTAMS